MFSNIFQSLFGEDSHFDSYFSKRLVQPPIRYHIYLERQVSYFLGNFTPKTSNDCLKICHLAFQVYVIVDELFSRVIPNPPPSQLRLEVFPQRLPGTNDHRLGRVAAHAVAVARCRKKTGGREVKSEVIFWGWGGRRRNFYMQICLIDS